MDDRIGGVDKPVIFIAIQSKTGQREIAAENPDSRLHVFEEAREFQMQLQTLPEPQLRFLWIFRAHQHVQSCAVILQQVGGDVRANVSGSPGYEYRHVTPFVPVFSDSLPSVSLPRVSPPTAGSCKLRGGRDSSGRPSISG